MCTTPPTEPPVSAVPWLHTLQSATMLAPEHWPHNVLQWVITVFPVVGPVHVLPGAESVTLPASMSPLRWGMHAPVTGSLIPAWVVPEHVPVCSGVQDPPAV